MLTKMGSHKLRVCCSRAAREALFGPGVHLLPLSCLYGLPRCACSRLLLACFITGPHQHHSLHLCQLQSSEADLKAWANRQRSVTAGTCDCGTETRRYRLQLCITIGTARS